MKFALRRTTEPDDAAPAVPPPPRPPRGAPVCAYAGVLDGRTLWLAVETRPGTLALRDTATGEVVGLDSDLVDDPTEFRSVRADLSDHRAASYDVVLVPQGGGTPAPVWAAPLAEPGPVRVPPSPDGTQLALRRTDDGTLQVHRTAADPGVPLEQVALVDDAVVLTLADGAGPTLALLSEVDDAVVLEVPVTAGAAAVPAEALPATGDLMTRVVVGSPGSWLPVRRRRSDLANPGHATLLPALVAPDDGTPLLRLRWKPAGVLVARLHPEGGAA